MLHLWSTQFPTPLARGGGRILDGLASVGLTLAGNRNKHSLLQRWRQETEFGGLARRHVAAFRPDVVLSANAPIDVQRQVQAECRALGVPFVLWLQDFYGIAIARILGRRWPGLGALVGLLYRRRERALVRRAAAIVAITPDFIEICVGWGIDRRHCHAIANWAPLDEIQPAPRDNPWARAHGLVGRRTVLYAGTLGFKHDPSIFLDLARRLAVTGDIVVVVSEGPGADWLAAERDRQGLGNLLVLPFQPQERVSEMLGAADLALAVLEPEAGIYSVPSKVLSYLAAGKPVVLSVPAENLAARTVLAAGAGIVAAPGDRAGLIAAVERLLADEPARAAHGGNARAYAEREFDIARIADRFEGILRAAMGR